MGAPADMAPWVIVAGGFHPHGGMDRANLALAAYLAATGRRVHLVGHDFDGSICRHRFVSTHPVARPRWFPGLAERSLAAAGSRVAARVCADASGARVVVNGGNCEWPDINWVHAVHAVWPVYDRGAPAWARVRNRLLKRAARRRERRALRRARLVIANSHASAHALVDHVGISPGRVHTVYLGSDATWGAVDGEERRIARRELGLLPDAPVAGFVGALGTDSNKGFDLLFEAWRLLARRGAWDVTLLVAGSGWGLARWRARARRELTAASIRFLGFTPGVRQLLAAADLLVSPVRYEAYGLNVHEAVCRGVPVMVTSTAGVTERFEPDMADALLPSGLTPEILAQRLRAWRADPDGWRERTARTGARLRTRTWDDMAAEFVGIAEGIPRRRTA